MQTKLTFGRSVECLKLKASIVLKTEVLLALGVNLGHGCNLSKTPR